MRLQPRIAVLGERTVCVVPHHGPLEAIDRTRRPLYRHMIVHELVGGPSILRFLDRPQGDRAVDALVTTHAGFDGDEVCRVETLAGGPYAVADYEGPEAGLAEARRQLRDWAVRHGHPPAGPLLQVHLMDPMEGALEAQLQLPVRG